MSSSDKPQQRIFRFLLPDPPALPTDASARTTRPLRIGTRSPLRIGLLLFVAVGLVIAAIPAALAAVVSGQPIIGAVAIVTVTVATMFLARGFLLGTYVNDESMIIRRMFSTTVVPWEDISVTINRSIVRVTDTNGREIATHIGPRRLDYLLRPHSYAIATDQLINWSERR